MVKFEGKYTRSKCEDYEAFLNELGVGFLLRKAATISTPVMVITQEDGGKWKIVTSTTLKSMEMTFVLGEEFEETTTDGRNCKTTVTQEGDNVWKTAQIDTKGKKDVHVTRVFSDDGIDVEMKCGSVVSKQFYKRDE